MKNKSQWGSMLLWIPPIFGSIMLALAFSEHVVAENIVEKTIAAETEKAETGATESEQGEKKKKPGFRIIEISSRLDNDVYRLDALIEYHLSKAVFEALVSGVPITIELQMEVVSPREWIWNKSIAELSQQYRIEYYALTQQYLVTNLNSQRQNIYSNQQFALDALGVISEFPLIDRQFLKSGDSYDGRLRARLMIEELPAPLNVLAYLSSEWRLASEWYAWHLQ